MKILYGKEYNKKNDIQYYFKFNNISQMNNSVIYDEYNFATNKDFKNIFFEEKDKIINKLDLFINNSDWYKNKGLPAGKLGIQLEQILEIKMNGLEPLIYKLKK